MGASASGRGVPVAWLGAAGAVGVAGLCALLFGGVGRSSSREAVTVRAIHNGAPLGAGETGELPAQPFEHNLTASDFDVDGGQRYSVFSAADGRRLECEP